MAVVENDKTVDREPSRPSSASKGLTVTIDLVPIAPDLQHEFYPGRAPGDSHSPWVIEPTQAFRPEDESRFWLLDFHFTRGFTPMGMVYVEDGQLWGTQSQSRNMPLPTGNGIASRMCGTFAYTSMSHVESDWEIGARGARLAKYLPRFLAGFETIWSDRVDELVSGLRHFESFDTETASLAELRTMLTDARSFHRRAWEIHFEMMYPLLANYLGFYGLCGQLGIDPGEIAKFLQGYDTKIMECDRELARLAQSALDRGLRDLFVGTEAERLDSVLRRDGSARGWVEEFDAFLLDFGWRTEGIADINLAPWIEDPTPPLGNIRSSLIKGEIHDFASAHQLAVEQREAAVDGARSRLTRAEQQGFDAALASCAKANFAWWNEEHNHYIDLRATIPLRRACLAIGEKLGADRPDDTLFLFWDEILDVLDGATRWSGQASLIGERRDYYDMWLGRRDTMPKVLGTIPESVTDPILLEVFGLHKQYFSALRNADADVSELVGVPASGGVVRGVARVLRDSTELHAMNPGEILVCEATTPNWTPAFAKIAACVCDGGGTLTHASIVSREYRIPCVVGVGVATSVVRDGDEIEVDGTNGIVRIFRDAA